MKKLNVEPLRSRRAFLKNVAKKGALPAVVVYTIHKNAPPLLGVSPP